MPIEIPILILKSCHLEEKTRMRAESTSNSRPSATLGIRSKDSTAAIIVIKFLFFFRNEKKNHRDGAVKSGRCSSKRSEERIRLLKSGREVEARNLDPTCTFLVPHVTLSGEKKNESRIGMEWSRATRDENDAGGL